MALHTSLQKQQSCSFTPQTVQSSPAPSPHGRCRRVGGLHQDVLWITGSSHNPKARPRGGWQPSRVQPHMSTFMVLCTVFVWSLSSSSKPSWLSDCDDVTCWYQLIHEAVYFVHVKLETLHLMHLNKTPLCLCKMELRTKPAVFITTVIIVKIWI